MVTLVPKTFDGVELLEQHGSHAANQLMLDLNSGNDEMRKTRLSATVVAKVLKCDKAPVKRFSPAQCSRIKRIQTVTDPTDHVCGDNGSSNPKSYKLTRPCLKS